MWNAFKRAEPFLNYMFENPTLRVAPESSTAADVAAAAAAAHRQPCSAESTNIVTRPAGVSCPHIHSCRHKVAACQHVFVKVTGRAGRKLQGEGVECETEACNTAALSALAWTLGRGRRATLLISWSVLAFYQLFK